MFVGLETPLTIVISTINHPIKKGKLQSLPAACVTFDGKTGNGHPKTAVKTATMWSPGEIENAKLGFT